MTRLIFVLALLPLAAGATEYGSPDRLFGYWTAACERDKSTRQLSCGSSFQNLYVHVSSEGRFGVSVLMGRGSSSIQIDDKYYRQKQTLGFWHFTNDEEIALALARAKKAQVSFTDFRGSPEFYNVELVGYRQALEYMVSEVTKAAKAARVLPK